MPTHSRVDPCRAGLHVFGLHGQPGTRSYPASAVTAASSSKAGHGRSGLT
ncbi:putative 7,8-didemethyl-8-hydroxy-5-deazariboflavin synthase [Mycobacterium xenopi 4042]|uniref:Putative 7,8-didemethyl-8-hydroxy-5-deazariboflavin synthase n=1 Tax=Mycobacterium xenopi 4042 TaxID=1299334 RepID=X8DZZ6_MYCXE|nr:putative 7,8-didemethyl-8-hydroxy-5-deazariboflavin synthase [Mycobacterium xenopi 4042]